MDDEEIRGRARSGEDSRTELKSVAPGVLPRADDVAKALVAFANSGGGDLIFGVEDSGLITGIGNRSDSDALQRHIGQIAASAVTPPLSPRTLAIEVDGKLVIVAHVPEFLPGRPFRGASKYFIRDGPSSREARPDELKTLLTSGSNLHYFDEQVVDSASRTDLDDTAIADFLRVAYPAAHAEQTERYLSALQAIDAAGHPTVSGIVLFGSEPTRFLPGAYVSAVRFPGLHASGTFKDRAEVCGNVFSQIEAAVAFLIRHVPTPSSVRGLERVTAGVPLEVWREVITNAVTHRDYASPNQVRVFVFDNRVEITNPGVLLNRLTVESVRLAGTKQPRNPHIASAVARKGQRDNRAVRRLTPRAVGESTRGCGHTMRCLLRKQKRTSQAWKPPTKPAGGNGSRPTSRSAKSSASLSTWCTRSSMIATCRPCGRYNYSVGCCSLPDASARPMSLAPSKLSAPP